MKKLKAETLAMYFVGIVFTLSVIITVLYNQTLN